MLEGIGNISLPNILPSELIGRMSTLITIFQAVGGFIIAYVIFNILNIFWNRKRTQEMSRIRQLLEQINKKLDKKR